MKSTVYGRAFVLFVAATLALGAAASAELRLGEHDFEWTDSDQERARFVWSAVVINDTDSDVAVDVSVDLLDDDDRIVHTETIRHQAVAGSQERVEDAGSLPFDKAVDVVSYRFRVDPVGGR